MQWEARHVERVHQRFLVREYVPWNGKLKYDWSLDGREEEKKNHGRESDIMRNTVNRGKYLRLYVYSPVAKV